MVEIKWYTSLSIYVDGANILSGSLHTVNKNTEALVFVSKETGLEVNADETKYVVMSRDQRAGQIQNSIW